MGRNAALPLALVVAIVAIFGFFLWRKSARRSEVASFLGNAGWSPAACPIAKPFGDWQMVETQCFRGKLRPNGSAAAEGAEVYLIKAGRWREGIAPKTYGKVMEMHVALYLPPSVAVKDGFPGAATPDGGHLMTWHTQHTARLIQSHLDEAASWLR